MITWGFPSFPIRWSKAQSVISRTIWPSFLWMIWCSATSSFIQPKSLCLSCTVYLWCFTSSGLKDGSANRRNNTRHSSWVPGVFFVLAEDLINWRALTLSGYANTEQGGNSWRYIHMMDDPRRSEILFDAAAAGCKDRHAGGVIITIDRR